MNKRLFQFLLFLFSLIAVIVLGIVFHSSAIVILNSVFGVTTIYLLSIGSIWGNVTGIVQLGFYSYLTIVNRYYAALVGVFAITLTSYIGSIITWSKNNKNGVVKVANNVKTWEWLAVAFFSIATSTAMYFVFGLFNTANLLLNSIIFGVDCFDRYLKVRRSSLSFVFQLTGYALSFGLWLSLILQGDLGYIPTVANYVIYIVFSVLSLFNWEKMRKAQQNPNATE